MKIVDNLRQCLPVVGAAELHHHHQHLGFVVLLDLCRNSVDCYDVHVDRRKICLHSVKSPFSGLT